MPKPHASGDHLYIDKTVVPKVPQKHAAWTQIHAWLATQLSASHSSALACTAIARHNSCHHVLITHTVLDTVNLGLINRSFLLSSGICTRQHWLQAS